MIVGSIYALKCTCHPAEPIRYIGKTEVGQANRFRDHLRAAMNGGTAPVHHWIRVHGAAQIEIILVESVEDTEPHAIDIAEGEWIRHCGLQHLNLLNCMMPRYGAPDRRFPPVVRQARTNALVGLLSRQSGQSARLATTREDSWQPSAPAPHEKPAAPAVTSQEEPSRPNPLTLPRS
jgi:hypothetical protein